MKGKTKETRKANYWVLTNLTPTNQLMVTILEGIDDPTHQRICDIWGNGQLMELELEATYDSKGKMISYPTSEELEEYITDEFFDRSDHVEYQVRFFSEPKVTKSRFKMIHA